jgi:hypothetical protein
MKRPSFQFYPGDWQSNSNLRRCTRAEKSVWLDVLCLMHDQEEYGVLRWTLKEIAEAAHCKVSELKALQAKGVLKGADKGQTCNAYIYTPRSGRRDGAPVELIPSQTGPIWYSSRFVRDEYVRRNAGAATRFGAEGAAEKATREAGGETERAKLRARILAKTAGHCKHCDEPLGSVWEIDHYIPRSKGGRHTFANMVPSCVACNQDKSDTMPDDWEALKSSPAHREGEGTGEDQGDVSTSSSSSSPTVNNQTIVELALDGGSAGEKKLTEAEKIEGIFAYWQRATKATKARLGEKRVKTIRAALRWGYSPRDLCRAIQGCALTPHNQGANERGQKYLGLHVCLGSEDQIDRFMANSKAPPVAPEKGQSGSIPRWWTSDELALQQANLVGVGPAYASEGRDAWHARITSAIENGGKPRVSIVAAVPVPSAPEAAKAEATPEQRAARRAALLAVVPGLKFGGSAGAEQENQKPVA